MKTYMISFVIAGLMIFLLTQQSFAIGSQPTDIHSTSFNEVGQVITLNTRVTNPYDYPASASIDFIFENIAGNNYWDTKKHTGDVDANSNFVATQSYFIQNTGKFYLKMVHAVDGKIITEPSITEFIVFEEYSKAALNGCGPDFKMIVKPDYSKLVCVFEHSTEKLAQRGWLAG